LGGIVIKYNSKKGGKMRRIRQTIKAGKKGTIKLVKKFGPRLVRVRYYYDLNKKKRITTVELIHEELKWEPSRIPPYEIVYIKLNWSEREMAEKIKKNGGKWNNSIRLWEIPFGKAKELGIRSKIVGD
jgi:hypothetical protein